MIGCMIGSLFHYILITVTVDILKQIINVLHEKKIKVINFYWVHSHHASNKIYLLNGNGHSNKYYFFFLVGLRREAEITKKNCL